MAGSIPSLGSGTPKLKRVRELFEQDPSWSRQDRVKRFADILNIGGVQRVVFDVKKPIEVERLVEEESDMPPMPDEVPDDLYVAARNGTLTDLTLDDAWQGAACLMHAFDELSENKATARVIFVHGRKEVKSWLKSSSDMKQLFGVPVEEHKEMPNDAVLLVASTFDPAGNELIYSIRIGMNLKKEVNDVLEQPPIEAPARGDPGVRPGGPRVGPADGGLGLPPPRLVGEGPGRGGGKDQGAGRKPRR